MHNAEYACPACDGPMEFWGRSGKWHCADDECSGLRIVGRCIGCFHDFALGPCGGCGAVEQAQIDSSVLADV